MKYPYVTIKDSILKWAIQESDIDNGTIYSRFPKLDDWISGKEQPTMKQLSDFSLMTHIPLGYFFLDNPPTESVGLLKYRTFNSVHNQKPSKNLLDTIFEMEMRQDWMREFLISNLEEKNTFVSSLKTTFTIEKLAEIIRTNLNIDIEWYKHHSDKDKVFNFLRHQISTLDILVMMNGIVGSNPRRSLNLEEFRAFTLIDEYAPLIFINAKDSTAGRIFSLIHELVHLGLGINSLFYDDRTSDINGYTGTERICNAVAAEILVPIESFKVMWEKYSKYDISSKITQLAKDFKISEAVIARRAFDLNYISHAIYNEMITNMIHKPKNITKRGGGDAIKTFLSRIDHNFFKTISQCVRTGHLLYTDAYRLTGLSRIFFDKATDIFEG